MKKTTYFIVATCLVLVMLFVGMAPACSPSSTAKTIKVGVVQAQTGAYAGFGTGDVFGIQAAVDDINTLGGVDVAGTKMKIDLVIVDNQSDPAKASTLAEGLVTQNNVQFIISGDEPPPMHPAVSNVAEKYKIPYITSVGPFEPWNAMRQATDSKWQYTWASGLFALAVGATGNDFRAGKPGYTVNDTWVEMLDQFGSQTNKKVAIVASDEPDGVGWYNDLPKIVQSKGYQVIGLDKKLGLLPPDTTDFSSVINEWKASGAEILWGNTIPPFFAALWKQCSTLGFQPKMVSIGRAALFYQDINSWGGNLPNGVGTEIWWTPAITEYKGIGSTTPTSLAKRWSDEKNQPLNPAIGSGYRTVQVLIDAIQRAKSVDPAKVNAALATTDLMTIGSRVKFDENHFNRTPIYFGQWFPTNTPEKWELKVVYSKHSFVPATAQPIFPIPYK
jgi:branched-chain amino acid transport system substrate-binding protein